MRYNCPAKFEEYLKNRVYPVVDTLKKIIVAQDEAVITVAMSLFSVGQRDFNVETKDRVLAPGNILLQGPTGQGKTIIAKTFAAILGGINRRVSGTGDLMPSDIVGGQILLLDGTQRVHHGPCASANILIVDEINRLSSRTQSAFLEMLAENQITIGDQTFRLQNPFSVLATLNPSESNKGTTQLAEALSDRFLFKVLMAKTTDDQKVEVARRTHKFNPEELKQVLSLDEVNEAREYFYDNIYVDDKIRYYCARLLNTINEPHKFDLFSKERENLDGIPIFKQEYPANDRALIHLENASMAQAMMSARDFVVPRDVQAIAHRVLRGRLLLNPAAVPTLLDVSKLYTESQLIDSLISQAIDVVRLA